MKKTGGLPLFSAFLLLAVFIGLLFFVIFLTPTASTRRINERLQDHVETSIGLGKLFESGRALLKSNDQRLELNENVSLLRNNEKTQVRCLQGDGRERPALPPIVMPSLLPGDKAKNITAVKWGKDSYALFDAERRYSFYSGSPWFYCAGLVLALLSLFGFVPSLCTLRDSMDGSFKAKLSFLRLGMACLLFPCGLAAVAAIDYDRYMILMQPRDDLKPDTLLGEGQKLLRAEKNTKLVSTIPELLQGQGLRAIFVAKRDCMNFEYLRVNLNLFNYVFVAPGIKDLNEINPLMKYTKLRDNLWLGSYEKEIKAYQILNIIALSAVLVSMLAFYVSMQFVILGGRKLKDSEFPPPEDVSE